MNFIDFEGTQGTEGASQILDQESWLGPSLPHRPRYKPFFRFDTQGNALETQSQVQGSLLAPFGPTHLHSPNPQSTTGNIDHAQPARIPAPASSPPVQLGRLIHLDYELFIPSVVHEVAHSANLSKSSSARSSSSSAKNEKEWQKLFPPEKKLPVWRTDMHSHTWESFKAGTIEVLSPIMPHFGRFLSLEIQKGTVSWQVAVVGARGYGISADVRASTEEHYIKFVEVADANRDNKLIVKLSMIDPEQPVKKALIVNQQVKGLTFHFGNQAEREQVARETARAIVNPKADTSTDPVTPVIAQIVERVVAKYGRDKEQLWMGHPTDSTLSIQLFPERLKVWARAIVHGHNDKVNLDTPPECKTFTWIKRRTPTIDEINPIYSAGKPQSRQPPPPKTRNPPAQPSNVNPNGQAAMNAKAPRNAELNPNRSPVKPRADDYLPETIDDLLEEDELAKSNSGSDIEVMTEHVGVPDQVDTPSLKQSRDGSPARKYMCSPSTDSMGEVMSKLSFSRHKTIGGGSSNDSPPRKRPAARVQPIPDPRVDEEPNPRKISLLGRAMTMDEFLEHCGFTDNDLIPRALIKMNHIAHWSSFLTLTVSGLMRLNFPEMTARQIKYGADNLDPDYYAEDKTRPSKPSPA
ncbi:hypothetical protein MJO28_009756 [Puccinia striiformis f. sp. tritici]|uniref:Uncharacterized protein n=1 Tax=Puccinia striiformis f. sp. tritici TaxID=168172 RepID=A0ACC0E8U5_9BASI|nr:hypothetical protein MJO28_009756 [Puccinia striiformis f. sp. tritici]